ncbi:MAG: ribbon-helix-helix protein, CopG family [Candidatus Methylomirabilales bacterium]
MKERTMIYLDAEELEALREEARAQRVSLAELLRRAVKQYLDRHHAGPPPNPEAYLKIVALGASGRADISERHDHYLAEALRREHAR